MRRTSGELLEAVQDLTQQFAYRINYNGKAAFSTGGLSALENAFDILGWDDPHPAPEYECQNPECHAWATCGTYTRGGYKLLCGRCRLAELARKEAEANGEDD